MEAYGRRRAQGHITENWENPKRDRESMKRRARQNNRRQAAQEVAEAMDDNASPPKNTKSRE